ncbi:MAG: response regulator transcription factor [Bacteroidia bacterium]|nr:response regulator transcription factor [Bacteroidia bacterium]
MQKFKTIIADDHQLFADGLCTILQQVSSIELVATVANGEQLLKAMSLQPVQLVILDLSMPVMNGLVAAERIRKLYPEVKILIVTMNDSSDSIRELMKLGVHGIVLKNAGKSELLLAVEELCKGESYYSQKITQQLAKALNNQTQDAWQLTKREREVLQLIDEGLTTAAIAEKLFISVYTVETHKKNLFIKSGVNKSALLIKEARALGYLK